MELKRFTIEDIRSWGPCYDPATVAPEGWQGTALDVLRSSIPDEDKLWVVLREECIDARALRLFAVWCARQALALVENPDPRSVAAFDVAERFANGQATADELAAASDAASDVARAAARAAESDAAWDAARAAASDAASAAAWAAASDAESDAARAAAWAAARAAARAAASDAAWAATSAAQVQQLIVMLEA